ncbi:MAG: hypothetical protein NVSMB38_46190 [Ktedonobacteraceae bacterium]
MHHDAMEWRLSGKVSFVVTFVLKSKMLFSHWERGRATNRDQKELGNFTPPSPLLLG